MQVIKVNYMILNVLYTFDDIAQNSRIIRVITSYSIHYTKLYDNRCLAFIIYFLTHAC